MKQTTFKILLLCIGFVLIALLIMLFFIKPNDKYQVRKNTTYKTDTTETMSPVFRKDGILRFADKSGNILVTIAVEVADNEEERMQGLMYRDSLPNMSGMLFMFETEEPQSFWMKNTRFSLDIIYLDSERNVVSISKNTKPYSLESLPSSGSAMYVVEVPAGFTTMHNIDENSRAIF